MAITTLDGVIAGFQPIKPVLKISGASPSAAAAFRAWTPWYIAGNPPAAVASSAGINGEALSGVVQGAIPRTNPTGGANAYIGRAGFVASQIGQLWIVDRLWQNSGLSVTSTSAQSITPVALPARSEDGTANGARVMAAIEWSATGGAGTPTVTLTYTDQDGNPGASAVMTGVSAPPVGQMEIFRLADGDSGVRAPTSLIQSATRVSGTMHLVLFRVLAAIDFPSGGQANNIDAITGGLPRVYDDSVLQLMWVNANANSVNFTGHYIETHG